MKKLIAAAAVLLLIGAGCSGSSSGNLDVNAPSGSVNVGAGGSAGY